MYTIEQLSLLTGLTTRTLRNYLKRGMLQGSKETGFWQFSDEQVSAFILHPSVYPSIQAKQHAMIYDFLAEQNQTESELCMLLNRTLGKTEAAEMAEFFCSEASKLSHIRFAYSYKSGKAHYILKGTESDVISIMGKLSNLSVS